MRANWNNSLKYSSVHIFSRFSSDLYCCRETTVFFPRYRQHRDRIDISRRAAVSIYQRENKLTHRVKSKTIIFFELWVSLRVSWKNTKMKEEHTREAQRRRQKKRNGVKLRAERMLWTVGRWLTGARWRARNESGVLGSRARGWRRATIGWRDRGHRHQPTSLEDRVRERQREAGDSNGAFSRTRDYRHVRRAH